MKNLKIIISFVSIAFLVTSCEKDDYQSLVKKIAIKLLENKILYFILIGFVRSKISEIINELPPNFVQIHRSYIVIKNLIVYQTGNSIFIEGKIEIPLSRNFK